MEMKVRMHINLDKIWTHMIRMDKNSRTNNESKWQFLESLMCHHGGGGGWSAVLYLQNLAGLETMHLKNTKTATNILMVKQ